MHCVSIITDLRFQNITEVDNTTKEKVQNLENHIKQSVINININNIPEQDKLYCKKIGKMPE